MRRTILSSLIAVVSAALVLAPTALAKGKPLPPKITGVSISGLPKEGESECPVSITVEYSGKAAHGDHAVATLEPGAVAGTSHEFKKSPFTYTDSYPLEAMTTGTHSFKIKLINKDDEVLSEVETSPFSLRVGRCFIEEGQFARYPFVTLTLSPGTLVGPGPTGASVYRFTFSGFDSQTFTVTNSGSIETELLQFRTRKGNSIEGFTAGTSTCDGKALAPGATCTVEVDFEPEECEIGDERHGAFDLVGTETLIAYLTLETVGICEKEPT